MSQTLTKRMFVVMCSALFLGIPVFAQYGGGPGGRMEYLGEANVDGAADHDNIVVTRARGTFRGIQLRVERAAIEFDRVIVHYGNGSSEPLQIRSRIPAGGSTRLIDLPGESRIIRSVELYYTRGNWANRRRPKVRLFGVH